MASIDDLDSRYRYVLVDISTMPREIIWYVLWKLDECYVNEANYVYHCPYDYNEGWLSRDPLPPRFVYKLSGIALPSLRTALLVTVGFDLQRVTRLIGWFEPSKLIVGVQADSAFSRNKIAMAKYHDMFKGEYDQDHCSVFELDAYSEDRGMASMERQLDELNGKYNIIMASLGPRITAISLYEIWRKNNSLGIAYTPSNQYSNYSKGIGESYSGTWR